MNRLSLVVACGHPLVAASLLVERGFWDVRAQQMWHAE